jgi:hypothetical protein
VTEAEGAVSAASDLVVEDSDLGSAPVNDAEGLDGFDEGDAGEPGPEGTGVADEGGIAADNSRVAFRSAKCLFHAPSRSFVTRRFHISVDSVEGRSGIT